ncbi:MAG: cupin domain-containing protein [Bdellovibrionales bacterium]
MIITRWQAPVIPEIEQIKNMFSAEGLDPHVETLTPDKSLPDHRHPFDEVRMVAKGEILLNIAGNKLLLREGDRITIPSNTKHSLAVGPHSDETICVCANKIY